MKKFFKVIGILLAVIVFVIVGIFVYLQIRWTGQAAENLALLGDEAPILSENGYSFRDLNKNGKLDPYEDARDSLDARVEDLLQQMTLPEKAGLLFINMIVMGEEGETVNQPFWAKDPIARMLSLVSPGGNAELVARKHMNHFNIVQGDLNAQQMAAWHNSLQKMAERTRLGIPVTIATDPRHGTGENPGANVFTKAFSHWPSALGLAATRDTTLVRNFGDIARQEYLAVGIRLALHPMADLATEPRWARINGTFGEDAQLSAQMSKAYILGFQGDSLNEQSVACMSKHFAGGGPQKDGEDPHFPYGKEQIYPGNRFDYHLIPFEQGVFPANTAQIMPYYGIPVGQTSEDVAFAFNREIITDMLRKKYGFEGVVCTDWNIITDTPFGEGRAWGVEHLTPVERVEKVLNAGCDMFGGESAPNLVIELVEQGRISEARLDESVRRVLRDKFRLGLFDNPYVSEETATATVGRADFVAKGQEAQRKSVVLLKNEGNLLPLQKGITMYIEGFDTEIASQFGTVVSSPTEAEVVLKRLQTPYEPRNESFLESFFHAGRLYFTEEEKESIVPLIAQKPFVVGITLERPAIIPEIADATEGLLADFGIEDEIFFQIVFGEYNPMGKLPFELPSSQEAVEEQLSDVPYDSSNPLFPFGHGLSY